MSTPRTPRISRPSSTRAKRTGSRRNSGASPRSRTPMGGLRSNSRRNSKAAVEHGLSSSVGPGSRTSSRASTPSSRSRADDPRWLRAQISEREDRLAAHEGEIKQLTRDNKVLAAQINKLKQQSAHANAKMNSEVSLRLKANQERASLEARLAKIQMAIGARLRLLGIDLTMNSDDIYAALETALAAIQKLTAELNEKEEILSQMEARQAEMEAVATESQAAVERLNKKLQMHKDIISEKDEELKQRDEALQQLESQSRDLEDDRSGIYQQVDELRAELKKKEKKATEQFELMNQANLDLEEELRGKNDLVNDLQRRLADAQKSSREASEENESLRQRVGQLESAVTERDETIKMAQEEERKTQDVIMESQSNFEERIRESEQAKERLEERLESDKRSHGENMNIKNEQMKEMREKMDDLKAELGQIQEEKAQLQTTVESTTQKVEQLSNERTQTMGMIRELEQDASKTEKELSASKQEEEHLARAIEQLTNELSSEKQQHSEIAHQLQSAESEVATTKQELENSKQSFENAQSQIAELEQQLQQSKASSEQEHDHSQTQLSEKQTELDTLNETLREKDEEMESLQQKLRDALAEIGDLQAELNKEKISIGVQTEFSDLGGRLFGKMDHVQKLQRKTEELREAVNSYQTRLHDMNLENKQLIQEVDDLVKQTVRFMPDVTNHKALVTQMASSPLRPIIATGSHDRTVRLWQVDPNPQGGQRKVQVFACSVVESQILSVEFSADGRFLAAGMGYKDGPDGYIIIWNMDDRDGEVEKNYRSRPSVRFGRVLALTFSDDGQYVFSGDTTGSVWVWSLAHDMLLARVQVNSDSVLDVSTSGRNVFWSAQDQSLCLFELGRLGSIRIPRTDDLITDFKHQAVKGTLVERNGRYPFRKIKATNNGSLVFAGSRKIHAFGIGPRGEMSQDGLPRISDTDTDFCSDLDVYSGLLAVCRGGGTSHCKVFDTNTGRELKKANFRKPAARVRFVHDGVHAVVCCQDKNAPAGSRIPSLHLWKYNDRE